MHPKNLDLRYVTISQIKNSETGTFKDKAWCCFYMSETVQWIFWAAVKVQLNNDQIFINILKENNYSPYRELEEEVLDPCNKCLGGDFSRKHSS